MKVTTTNKFNIDAVVGGTLQMLFSEIIMAYYNGLFKAPSGPKIADGFLTALGNIVLAFVILFVASLLVLLFRFIYIGKQTRKDLRSSFAWSCFVFAFIYSVVAAIFGISSQSPLTFEPSRFMGYMLCLFPFIFMPWPPDYSNKWES
jgi:hypothetical protein